MAAESSPSLAVSAPGSMRVPQFAVGVARDHAKRKVEAVGKPCPSRRPCPKIPVAPKAAAHKSVLASFKLKQKPHDHYANQRRARGEAQGKRASRMVR
jgi:hypothetical protein